MKQQACTLLFLLNNKKILLAMKKRGFGKGRWNGVGGKIEKDEDEQTAMIRECQEEIEVTPLSYVKVAHPTFQYNGEHGPQLVIVHTYVCHKWNGIPAETDEMAPRWFNINAIPYDEMWDDDKYWLQKVLVGKKLRASFCFDDNDLVTSKEIKEVQKL